MEVLKSNKEFLSKTDKQILEFINNNIDKVVKMSINELASATFCSKATISRFIRKFNYKNYKDFTLNINYTNRKYNELTKNKKNTIIEEILNQEMFAIENLNISNRDSSIKSVVDKIDKSKKIIIVGFGSSGLAAQELHFNLSKIGMNCFWSESIDRTIPVVSNIQKDDLLILISKSATQNFVNFMIKVANNKKAKIVLITSNHLHNFEKQLDAVIIHNNSEQVLRTAALTSKVSQNIIVDLIYNVLVQQNDKYKEKVINSRKLFLDWLDLINHKNQ